jgi:hypothetical protein
MSLTGINVNDNTLTGDSTFYVDELNANTITLGNNDLQTTLDNLQSQITSGGGYFMVVCEYNGNAVASGFFGFGSGTSTSSLQTIMPNSTCIGYRYECASAVTADLNIVVLKNGTSQSSLNITFNTGDTLKTATGTFATFTVEDEFSVRFSSGATGAGGTAWRCSFIFETAAVNGTNGTDGQNVSFNTPTFTQLVPSATASISDTITTVSNTQTHQLNFSLNRGRSSYFSIGSVTNTTGDPSVTQTTTTDGNGDYSNVLNFVLKQGQQGIQGPKGDKGDQGDQAESTIAAGISAGIASAAAAAASASAVSAASSAAAASVNGAIAGAQAGTDAANAVTSALDTRVTTLEGEMDIQQTKTLYINQSSTNTTISGGSLNVNTNINVSGSTILQNGLTVSASGMNITGNSVLNGYLHVEDNFEVVEDSTFGTDGNFNEHNLYGTTYIQKLESIANIPLEIGTATTDTEMNSTNIYFQNTLVDIDATNITLSSDNDFSEITIGSILDLNTSCEINTRNINIGTNAIGMTSPVLNVGTFNRTTTQIRGETIEILASEDTSINGSNNLELDATNVIIGHVGGDVSIQGSTIDIGTSGVLNYINIGNDYSVININSGISQYVNIDNFVNQLGF